MDSDMIISRIEELAKQKGISKTKALTESGAGKDFIANIKKGQTPSVAKLQKLSEYFEVSTDYLLGIDKSESDISGNIPADLYILQDALSSRINIEIEKLDDDQKKHLLTYIRFMQEQDKIAADEPVAASIKTKFSI